MCHIYIHDVSFKEGFLLLRKTDIPEWRDVFFSLFILKDHEDTSSARVWWEKYVSRRQRENVNIYNPTL